MLTKPFKFRPQLKSVLWGGHRIAALKNIPNDSRLIGESWEISSIPGKESVVVGGEYDGLTITELITTRREEIVGNENYELYGNKFPLLVKIIDAHQNLSIQVHPNDELALVRHNSPGKTEMWYIVATEAQSTILAGLNQPLTPTHFELLANNGLLPECLTHYMSKPGDVFYLPAGTIHSIGAGNLLVEIQQASDITYRLYDYDRLDAEGQPRELHIEQAKDAINYTTSANIYSHSDQHKVGISKLAKCEYFDVCHLAVDNFYELPWQSMKSFMIMVCIDGNLDIITNCEYHTPLRMGESLLIPASVCKVAIKGQGKVVTAQVN
ncbi:MAG: class I mannose-6-phosphate isomerase [Muribaculaceae bacterium]|nr:class I mannose-6-phosphate isomerase [Muribaculaceae bacterium]